MKIFFKNVCLVSVGLLFSCDEKQNNSLNKADTNHIVQTADTLKANMSERVTEVLPDGLEQFIPKGYSVLNSTLGNLNLDEYDDMILVLKKDGEDTTSNVIEHPEKRPLLILIGQSGNVFKMVSKSNNVVYCEDCGGMMGDPFSGITIKNGYFSAEHYGGSNWRWTRIITFKYSASDKKWYLHKDGTDSFHTSDPDKMETKILTTKDFGKVLFEDFDIYKEK
jgi:hypothetical protein